MDDRNQKYGLVKQPFDEREAKSSVFCYNASACLGNLEWKCLYVGTVIVFYETLDEC